ncbi:uncharacterized protein LOC132256058 [Phlebotomus argentipes]|uniref:uncharacterized protein LOC132256058 n=1 Tax=Phlebotomus argentipes TaxID=94469 RepID=UPI002892B994|nr:uncharacterized protein LOC132256058 [Phlebotomus argentipes]
MTSQSHLISWLNRPHLRPMDSLKLTIKVWNSIDFINPTKYETLVKYFCEKLPDLCHLPENAESEELWASVREFCQLKIPVGVVTFQTKSFLIDTLIVCLKAVDLRVFSVLKSTSDNSSLASFFSSNISAFCRLQAKTLVSWMAVLEQTHREDGLSEDEKRITAELLKKIQEFCQHQASNSAFREIYLRELHQQLTELVIYLQKRRMNWKSDFFGMLRGVFFGEDATKWYRDQFEAPEGAQNFRHDRLVFTKESLHVCLMNIEAFFSAFRGQKELCVSLADFLFRNVFVPGEMEIESVVLGISHVMLLMRSYNIKPEGERIKRRILTIVEEFSERNTRDCLMLILSALRLNPVIFADDLLSLLVKFLFLPKNESILSVFSQFFALCLETFHKLGRFEKMLAKLLDTINVKAISMDFPKKLKRKLKDDTEMSAKRQKMSESGAFLELLCEKQSENRHKTLVNWTEISFAWSDEISWTFSRIILTLLPNASLSVWKTLIFHAQNALNTAKDRKFDENSLFFLDFASKIICAYLEGCRLLEKPADIAKKIDERRLLMKTLFKCVELPERPLRACLEIYLQMLDFDAALLVYRPDSLPENDQESFQRIEYLDEEAWKALQNRITDGNVNELLNSAQLKLFKLSQIERTSESFFPQDLQDELWLIKQLSREQKIVQAQKMTGDFDLEVFEDQEFMEIFLLDTFQRISDEIHSKKLPFCKIDFGELLRGGNFDGLPETILSSVKIVNLEGKINRVELQKLLAKLTNLPLGFLAKEAKTQTLFFLLILLHSLQDFEDLKDILLHILRNLTELGNEVDVFRHISVRKTIEMFPNAAKHRKIFELLLNAATNYQTEANLAALADLLPFLEVEKKPICRNLCFIAVRNFSQSRRFHKFEKEILQIGSKLTSMALQLFECEQEIDGLLPAFTATLSALFSSKDNSAKVHEDAGRIAMRFMCKEDGGNALDLLKIVVDRRESLAISRESLAPIVLRFWKGMKMCEKMANILMSHCTNEEFQEILQALKEEEGVQEVIVVLRNLGGCNMSEEKGETFAEFYEQIMWEITSSAALLDILQCHVVVVKNKKIPLHNSLFSNMLTFLLEINLKRLMSSMKDFSDLHLGMIEFCHAVNQHRSSCLKFAMPQFVAIFKGLVHGICGFRSERSKKDKLDKEDIEILTGLAHKLEVMIAFMASKSKNAKRVAPFMLVFVINEMIYNHNSATLNPSIKTHINNMCHSLISMCDPNYGQFILRSCSEASRSVYKTLLKEYEKYRKFHGKV